MSITRKTDEDEFAARARRNLEPEEDNQSPEITISAGGSDAVMAELADLDDLLSQDNSDIRLTPAEMSDIEKLEQEESRKARRELVRAAVTKYGMGSPMSAENYERFAELLAEQERRKYAERILREEGRPVRRYRTSQDPAVRKAEKAAAARAAYASEHGRPVRAYRKLADMTPEERAAHQRKQALARQHKKRGKKSE